MKIKLLGTIMIGMTLLFNPMGNITNAFNPQNQTQGVINCNFIETQFIGMLFPYISDAIKDYYGEYRVFNNAKLLSIKPTELGQYTFIATVQVKSFVGPHGPPFGLETITIKKELTKIYVSDFKHKEI